VRWIALAFWIGSSSPLVDATTVAPGLRADLRYATADNLLGRPLTQQTTCLLQPDVAQALARAQRSLARQGLGLLVWDCYRPAAVQQALWDRNPHPGQVANPRTGSNHTRGAAVDLTLVAADGGGLPMPTDFDDFTPKARQGATDGVSPAAQKNRETLRRAMTAEGFTSIRLEWWHFDAAGARSYPLIESAAGSGGR
jgi:D-alanyl-D-alanine dipeptidase